MSSEAIANSPVYRVQFQSPCEDSPSSDEWRDGDGSNELVLVPIPFRGFRPFGRRQRDFHVAIPPAA